MCLPTSADQTDANFWIGTLKEGLHLKVGFVCFGLFFQSCHTVWLLLCIFCVLVTCFKTEQFLKEETISAEVCSIRCYAYAVI